MYCFARDKTHINMAYNLSKNISWKICLAFIFVCHFISKVTSFTLWDGRNDDTGHADPFALMNLCPMTDCGPIESQLQCAHQDRYLTQYEIMGQTCSGCPACRDYAYFVKLLDKTYKMAAKVLTKTKEYTDLVSNITESLESLQHMAKQAETDSRADNTEQIIQKLSQELHILSEDSAMIKVSRYLDENAKELEDIVNHSVLVESRLDLNTHGFYGHFWQPSLQQYDIDLLPFFDKHRYAELLNDRLLDKTAELLHLIERIDISTEKIQMLAKSLKDSTDDKKITELEEKTPLMLRRIYQLLESNTEAFTAFTTIDTRDLHSLVELLAESVNVTPDTTD